MQLVYFARCRTGTRRAYSISQIVKMNWADLNHAEILDGSALCVLGSKRKAANVGDTAAVPAGMNHLHLWNSGAGEMIYRQITMQDFGQTLSTPIANAPIW